MSFQDIVFLKDDFICCRFENNSASEKIIKKDSPHNAIQFHFILKEKGSFLFNGGSYVMEIREESGLILYNPKQNLPIHVRLAPGSSLISILISVNRFHRLFSAEGNSIPFLAEGNIDKKHYSRPRVSPLMSVALSQIMNSSLHSSVQDLYFKAKIYELLSFLFNTQSEVGSCPIKAGSEEMRKIQQAKNILIDNMTTPPTIQELSSLIGLNTKKLKEGFKQIYGNTVYGFLINHKMEYAQKLLDKDIYNVNEVSAKVGYSAASHFISAFKKKFGITPKQYLTSSKTIKNERDINSKSGVN